MIQRRLDESKRSPSRLVYSVPVFVDEVLRQSNRAIKTASVNLKLQLLTNSKPGKTTHTVRFTYRTLVLGREALVSQLPFGEKLSQPYEVHAVPPFLILDGGPVLWNANLDLGRLAPHPRVDDELHEELSRDRKSTRLNSSHSQISYAVFCLKKKKTHYTSLYLDDI